MSSSRLTRPGGDETPRLPFEEAADAHSRRDETARRQATDPRRNVVLEASAGTGKTTVLVNRYLNLLKAGVDPTNILAITFTRKAAAEMRQRIVTELEKAAALSAADAARWHDLRDRLGDIGISTIDAFCLSLLREFPLEAGLDPGFDVADETLVAHLKEQALDRALAICRRLAVKDEGLRLLVAQLGESRLRQGIARLLDRRQVARSVLRRVVGAPGGRMRSKPGDAKNETADLCRNTARRLSQLLETVAGGLEAFLDDGPMHVPAFDLLAADIRYLATLSRASDGTVADLARFRPALDAVRTCFLTSQGEPRKRPASAYGRRHFASDAVYRRHARAIADGAPQVAELLAAFSRDLNLVVSRGVKRAFEVATHQFDRELEANGVLDFSGLLEHTLKLLSRMDEFSQSRYRLESRYHHVLVDEFQDTSRAQWRLVSLLVKSWGEGAGLAGGVLPPSIFVVGDRKQSIYGFRDADAAILGRARRDIEALRAEGRVRRSISRSFRSAPALLAFANDLFASMQPGTRPDRFRFGPRDTFPVEQVPAGEERVGVVMGDGGEACAAGVADEIARLIAGGTVVRDPRTKTPRSVAPGDIAILFRSREGHQDYERALADRGVASYVYKGLGFFDADETKDLIALVDYLARPHSDLAAAAFLRSRFARLSDRGLRHLAPAIAASLRQGPERERFERLDSEDRRVFEQARRGVAAWLPQVDCVTPAELIDRVLEEAAYAYEMRGARRIQARENVKKMRALVRKIQNRGYATLADVGVHLRTLSAGDESNAVVDAVDAVNLMTVHAAKGLEFPVVFLVNLCRGTGGGRDPIRVSREGAQVSVSVGDFTSDADDQAGERDAEETKRLLYVAVTRARDRLYFSSPLKEGRFEPRRGSLGSVLPAPFAALLAPQADPSTRTTTWIGPSGRAHDIRVCPCPAVTKTDTVAAEGSQDNGAPLSGGEDVRSCVSVSGARETEDRFDTLACDGLPRIAATTVASTSQCEFGEHAQVRDDRAPGDRRLHGLLVHRLFQYLAREGGLPSHDELERRAHTLAGAPDLALSDAGEAIARAVADLERICADARVAPLLHEGRWFHELPFSMVQGGVLVRGVIDSVVEHGEEVTVVELKTGRARPEHADQLELYRAAATMLFPGRSVRAVLVYVDEDRP